MKIITIIAIGACIVIGASVISQAKYEWQDPKPSKSDCLALDTAGEQALRECLDEIIEWQEAEALLSNKKGE